jgi:charged multivesicular body protein 6
MGGIFGKDTVKKPEPPKITDRDRAILDLKNARDRTKRYITDLDKRCKKLRQNIKVLVKAGKKDRAITMLRSMKMLEKHAANADNQLLNVYKLVEGIEQAITTNEILAGIERGTKVMTELRKNMPIEKVEKLLEDNEEAIEAQREVEELLINPGWDAALGIVVTEEETRVELEELSSSQVASTTLPDIPSVTPVVLPSIPNTTPKTAISSATASPQTEPQLVPA